MLQKLFEQLLLHMGNQDYPQSVEESNETTALQCLEREISHLLLLHEKWYYTGKEALQLLDLTRFLAYLISLSTTFFDKHPSSLSSELKHRCH